MFRQLKRKNTPAGGSGAGDRLEPLGCSFCHKRQADVRTLIAGPAVYICDECIRVCVEIIADGQRLAGAVGSEVSEGGGAPGETAIACALCGEQKALPSMLLIEGRGALCGGCADAVEDVLNEGRPASADDANGSDVG